MSTRICPTCGAEVGGTARFCPACGGPVPDQAAAAGGDPYIGKTIASKFYVQKLLGAGGMGKVYKAQHLSLDKPVCIKMLRRNLLDDPSVVARFQREARASSRLNHANSIGVIDFGQAEDGALYIAMEYLAGRDLQRVLVEEFPLQESRICHIMAQALSALDEAHANGIIHRDLKPENIMIEPRREDPDFVKVLDFGIAKIQDPSGGEGGPALTRAGLVCGTPEYMSPEQARGATLDARSDLYAIGVILYQLVTGYLPFDADTPIGFVTKHLTENPIPPRQKRTDVPISEAMERIIMRCMEKDVAKRPASAEALRGELLLLGSAPAVQPQAAAATPSRTQMFTATPGPGTAVGTPPPSARPAPAASAATSSSTQMFGPGSSAAGAPAAAAPAPAAASERSSPGPAAVIAAGAAVAAAGAALALSASPEPGPAPAPLPTPPPASETAPTAPARRLAAVPEPAAPAPKGKSRTGIIVGIAAAGLLAASFAGLWFGGIIPHGAPREPGTSGKFEPGTAGYLTELGEYRLENNVPLDAINFARSALQADPNYPEAHRLMGNACVLKGEAHKAARAYREYLRLAPTAADAGDVKAKLAALGG